MRPEVGGKNNKITHKNMFGHGHGGCISVGGRGIRGWGGGGWEDFIIPWPPRDPLREEAGDPERSRCGINSVRRTQ